jgi:hypothetical protein
MVRGVIADLPRVFATRYLVWFLLVLYVLVVVVAVAFGLDVRRNALIRST